MDVTRIDLMIASGEFSQNPILLAAMHHAGGRRLHLMGLLSDGGVHSMNTHLYALLEMAKREGVIDVCVHCFMDGRDTPPESGAAFIEALQKEMRRIGIGRIATVSGRYYAMDRDKRWERTKIAYDALVFGKARSAPTVQAAIDAAYARDESDEFVEPTIIGEAAPIVHDHDACFFFNFRPDRARQLTRAFSQPGFSEFPVKHFDDLFFGIMTLYDDTFKNPVMFGRIFEDHTLGEVVANAGLRQLRLAETEKYAHVTYFFSGGREEPFPNEDRVLVPSAREVGTYDHLPQMRAREITDRAVEAIRSRRYSLIMMNYANPDMVGHTGDWDAIVQALEVVDECLGRLEAAVLDTHAIMLLTADHGNAEEKVDLATGLPLTAHTCNDVPLVIVSDPKLGPLRSGGKLADVAPTICEILKLPQPAAMTGHALL
jgi:2,3-bisphosphoglycerate-independent phosphoglycerate mutase